MLSVSLDCLSSPYVLCTQCCQFLWIVCLRLMSCVPKVASFFGLFVFALCLVYPMLPVSLDCFSSPYVLCTQCCRFLWIVCLRLMSCVPNVAGFSGLFVFVLCLVYPMLPISPDCLSSPYVLWTQCCQFLWVACFRLMSCVPNVASFSGLFVFALCLVYPMLPVSLDCLSSPYVLCTQCCQFLWIVFTLYLVYPMLPASLDCLSSPYVLCTQCCQFL
jgi:hypothetical protein